MIDGRQEDTELGTPQGGVISPLLANIYLHPLDLWWEKTMPWTKMVRYADDMVVLCPKWRAGFRRMPFEPSGLGVAAMSMSCTSLNAGEILQRLSECADRQVALRSLSADKPPALTLYRVPDGCVRPGQAQAFSGESARRSAGPGTTPR